jgi:putative phosphoribosyl transferase
VKFNNRKTAGLLLSRPLSSYRFQNAVVIGLVRGGAVVAGAVSESLSLPFDILVVKKIPSPDNAELAIGAITSDAIRYINTDLITRLHVPKEYVKHQIYRLTDSIREKNRLYRGNHLPIAIDKKTVILIDDGIATGATMLAAIQWVKAGHAGEIVVASPVAPPETIQELSEGADYVYILEKPPYFSAVGQFYEEFEEVTDNEVIELLRKRD